MKKLIQIDPLGKYSASQDDIMQSAGFLPVWLTDPSQFHKDAKTALLDSYGFGDIPEMDFGTIDADGTYHYEGDPDAYPIYKMTRGEETIFQYKYGIIAVIREDGSSWMARMD